MRAMCIAQCKEVCVTRKQKRPRLVPCMARHGIGANPALSISVSHYGYASAGDEHILGRETGPTSKGDAEVVGRPLGASCEWPRACDWPMKDSRTRSQIAQDAMNDAAAAVAVSGALDWPPEATVYTRNDEVDTDLPPDVELLAFFSDSPISWRAHESDDDNNESWDDADVEAPSFWDVASNKFIKWWSKMWRYQGLGL